MQFYKTKQCIILPVLVTIITFTILSLPELENQYANSQSNETELYCKYDRVLAVQP